ncbi:MAG TPA: DUF86 domain-containing protein [Thermoanaerobaculia bacterium]|nr:DUF86 domain-containing protein [Thermoanaerobaculia bacterium]
MTDLQLVAKKLALIETCVAELRSLVRLEAVQEDIRELRFAAYTLHIAIQAALDVAAHVVADNRLGEPQNNRELFELLTRYGWISRELTGSLREMVGFRNIVVHGYERLNAAIVEEILRNHLDDLLQFVNAIRAQLI